MKKDKYTKLAAAIARGQKTFGSGVDKKEICTECNGAGIAAGAVCARCKGQGCYAYIPPVSPR